MGINKSFTITKRIAKHGNQVVILVPKVLHEHLPAGTVVEVNINILEVVGDGN